MLRFSFGSLTVIGILGQGTNLVQLSHVSTTLLILIVVFMCDHGGVGGVTRDRQADKMERNVEQVLRGRPQRSKGD